MLDEVHYYQTSGRDENIYPSSLIIVSFISAKIFFVMLYHDVL